MLRKTIKYTDVFDVERQEDFYFNISKAELYELELTTKGGYQNYLQSVVNSQGSKETFEAIKKLVKLSYGVRTDTGAFIKNEESWAEFEGTGAYDNMIVGFFDDVDSFSDFANGILPQELIAAREEREAQPGFRPGAPVLPQSRREALAQEQTQTLEGPAVQPYDPSHPGSGSVTSNPIPTQSFNPQTPEEYLH